MAGVDDILNFWIGEVGEAGWYRGGAALDGRCRSLWAAEWEAARQGRGSEPGWGIGARASLARIVLFDQLPRNMFRGTPQAFATDARARCEAKRAIAAGLDLQVAEPERQFFYLPMMHSESLGDQDRGVALFATRMPQTGASNLLHARAHREQIRRFGRFPERNAALGRKTSAAEAEFLARGGYGALVEGLKQAA